MEKTKETFFWGLVLIVLGLVFLIGNFSRIGMGKLWPLFLLAAGLVFWAGFFQDRKNVGLLMPGSIFIVVGLLFFYCTFAGWHHMANLWPVFVLAPAVGFVSLYLGGQKDAGLLVPAGILGGIGIAFLFISHGLGVYWPVLLILAGILLIVLHFVTRKINSS